MTSPRMELEEVARQDFRYAFEAYEFLCHALAYTQKTLGRLSDTDADEDGTNPSCHVSGQELLMGIRDFAAEQFGMMSATVFRTWGIRGTGDFGQMVYNLIDAGLWHCSDDDSIEDFHDLYDFDEVFVREYEITWDEL